jgi:predicted MFS family arabinose efflux permease
VPHSRSLIDARPNPGGLLKIAKRGLIAAGVAALAVGALIIAFFPSFWPVMTGQILIGGMSSVFGPAICAISLGVVGRELFDRRQGSIKRSTRRATSSPP